MKFLRGYQADVRTDVALPAFPALDRGIWFGGATPRSIRELNVWLALADEAALAYRIAVFRDTPGWELVLPPSRQTMVEAFPTELRESLGLSRPDQSFAVIRAASGKLPMLIRGLPTEDAWEAFLACRHDTNDATRASDPG
ncbi:MAG: hypothetical protein SFX74_06970 [Fimbriimonadaceae bacterium]|nr:hypothetical protein [Fimbriimonadaceae bacterium]